MITWLKLYLKERELKKQIKVEKLRQSLDLEKARSLFVSKQANCQHDYYMNSFQDIMIHGDDYKYPHHCRFQNYICNKCMHTKTIKA